MEQHCHATQHARQRAMQQRSMLGCGSGVRESSGACRGDVSGPNMGPCVGQTWRPHKDVNVYIYDIYIYIVCPKGHAMRTDTSSGPNGRMIA